jgi:hypothetical protein
MVEEQPVVARAAAVAILQLLPYDEAKLAVDQWLACLDAENDEPPAGPASVVNIFDPGSRK